MDKRFAGVVILAVFSCCLMIPLDSTAGPLTHRVEKGDTLWSICEKYYGDANLWPKLWQMNPFVTNPHLINPGETITLLEAAPKKAEPEKMKPVSVAKKKKEPAPKLMGIDVSSMTNTKALGYISRKEVTPVGEIYAADTNKKHLAEGDTVFVRFKGGPAVKVGDEFNIASPSDKLYFLPRKKTIYVVSVRGRLVLKENIKKSYYRAKIVETFNDIRIEDMILPYEPVSPCVLPIPMKKQVKVTIAAIKGEVIIAGKYSVVYLDRGLDHGIRRGHLFNVVEERTFRDPDVKREALVDLKKKTSLPSRQLGKILVLESRPQTATAVVLTSLGELPKGSSVHGISWVEKPEILSSVPPCPLK
ncbi:LysM peptidoglycan-binding domain-containing protein [Thermodesulfobacteriota bacterium]